MTGSAPAIALFVPTLGGGGAERVALNLARGFLDRDIPVDIVAADAKGGLRAQVPAQARVVSLGARRVLRALPGLIRYLRAQRPQAVIAFMDHANIVALWARRLSGVSPRIVVTVHNTLSVALGQRRRASERFMPALIRRFYPWADELVAVSHGVATDLSRVTGLAPDRIRVVYNPVITPDIEDAATAPPPHPWLAPGEPPVVLGVGRLTAQKDFSTLLRAFAVVRAIRPARLLILGEGPDRPDLEQLARELGVHDDVLLPGFVAGSPSFMRHAAVFVLSSAWEGLPTVLIEALAVGTAVVATDCPSGPREILRDGQLGRLVPPGDTGALARGILEQLAGPRSVPPPGALHPFTQSAATEAYVQLATGNGWHP